MMEVDGLNLNDSCRSCLSSGDDLESIFECYYNNEIPLAEILMNLVAIHILEDDGLSSKICELCRIKATQTYEFQQTFLNSDREMRDFLKSGNHPIYKFEQTLHETAPTTEVLDEEIVNDTESFVQIQEYIKHEPESEDNFQCEGCLATFPSMEHAVSHKCLQNNETEENTPVEEESPVDDPISIEPISSKSRRIKYICPICQLPTDSPSKLHKHLNTHNKDKSITNTKFQTPTFDCADCFKQFYNEGSLNRHKVLHSDLMKKSKMSRDADEMFLCVICSIEIPDYEELFVHMRSHRINSKDQVYNCQLCNKDYPGIKNIIRHSKTHEENATHQCFICCKRMGIGEDLIDHMLRHEGTYKPHKCPACGKGFLKNFKLVAHMKTHDIGEAKIQKLPIKRERKTTAPASTTVHVCEECGKSFQNKDYLKKHLIRHSGIKPYGCTICSLRFTFRSGLNAHLFVHNGLKPHSCKYENCTAAFSNTQALKKHHMIHTGNRPHICELCTKTFVASKDLKRHQRTHTGEKPYKCNYCDNAYAQSNDLIKHTRGHIGDNIYQCGTCKERFPLQGLLKTHALSHIQEASIEELQKDNIE